MPEHVDSERPRLKRQQKLKGERQRELEDDAWSSDVDAVKGVQCKGCTKRIRLGREFEVKNWEKHRSKCPRITNEARVRVSGIKRITTETPVNFVKPHHMCVLDLTHAKLISRADFFNNAARQVGEQKARVETAKMVPGISEPQEQKYVTKKIKVVSHSAMEYHDDADLPKSPSIAHIWADVDPNIKPKSKGPKANLAPDLQVCRHLSGPGYDDYIRLVQTRSLGGISPELHARIIRQCFPYKKGLPELGEGRTIGPKGKLPLSSKIPSRIVPKDGDKCATEKHWTVIEHQ